MLFIIKSMTLLLIFNSTQAFQPTLQTAVTQQVMMVIIILPIPQNKSYLFITKHSGSQIFKVRSADIDSCKTEKAYLPSCPTSTTTAAENSFGGYDSSIFRRRKRRLSDIHFQFWNMRTTKFQLMSIFNFRNYYIIQKKQNLNMKINRNHSEVK